MSTALDFAERCVKYSGAGFEPTQINDIGDAVELVWENEVFTAQIEVSADEVLNVCVFKTPTEKDENGDDDIQPVFEFYVPGDDE